MTTVASYMLTDHLPLTTQWFSNRVQTIGEIPTACVVLEWPLLAVCGYPPGQMKSSYIAPYIRGCEADEQHILSVFVNGQLLCVGG